MCCSFDSNYLGWIGHRCANLWLMKHSEAHQIKSRRNSDRSRWEWSYSPLYAKGMWKCSNFSRVFKCSLKYFQTHDAHLVRFLHRPLAYLAIFTDLLIYYYYYLFSSLLLWKSDIPTVANSDILYESLITHWSDEEDGGDPSGWLCWLWPRGSSHPEKSGIPPLWIEILNVSILLSCMRSSSRPVQKSRSRHLHLAVKLF